MTKQIFARLLAIRDAQCSTNEQIAIQMGRTPKGKNHISRYLNGHADIPISTFVRLCNAIEALGGVEIDYNELFKNSDNE
jgi:transcriptional regulator with XRE-family HTH domain